MPNAEATSRSIIEALSCGIPVIGSSAGGIPELVSQNFLFKRASVSDLEDKLKKMTKSQMIIEAKRSFEKSKDFRRDTLDNKRANFYTDFIKNNRQLIKK